MNRINVNLYPKDGHFFKDRDGSLHRGKDWPEVIVRVREYRKRNKMPAGDPEQEIHDQACTRNAHLCHDENPEVIKMEVRRTSMKGRVLKWLAGIRKSKSVRELQFVPEEEAKQRADICAACPVHTAYPAGCGSCKLAVRESRKEILGRRNADERLNGCNVLGEDLGSSVHLDQVRVNDSELPAECWRKQKI